ncbi:Protein SMG8, partial [Stegodyphus mimosarum]
MAKELDLTENKQRSQTSSLGSSTFHSSENTFTDHMPFGSDNNDHSFSKFLFQHINLALTKGFDDNVGRYPVPAYFELASAHTWFTVACSILTAMQSEPKDAKSRSFHQTIKAALDTDVKFSEGRCAKVLPLASAAYQDNLPTHYTEDYHQNRLAHALHVFNLHARGPAVQRFAKQLKEDCERLWKNGHQMCEVLSLTGNNCMNPIHRTTDDDSQGDKNLPIMPHCSQVKILSTCDCGRKQGTRDDPFDVKAANHDFYIMQRNQCCRDLERIEFPVFQASTVESHPVRISPIPILVCNEDSEEKIKETNSASSSTHGNNLSKAELSEGNSEENSLTNEIEQLTTDDQSQSQAEDERDEIVIRIQDDISCKDRSLTRQPSTTEYLPGMLHSESRLGLLPKFPSWSLVCLGPSSLYSHNIGLQEQPGFIVGTNYLLPWDVTVKLEQKERWPALWEGKRPLSLKAKKAIRDGPQFNVKIFIGVEYECYHGHRFMCSAPDRVLRVTSTGHVKDNASKVTGSDMPLYFPCPFRSSKPQIAQLMRIHVVTPKAPVHVTLNPKVQPAPEPCPLFFPTLNEPLKLSQSAYWVLRLPFLYEGEHGPYLPPREPMPVSACRLLKGMYNIAEQQSNR